MQQLQNGFCLDTPAGTFPLSTDTMLLADFVRLPKDARVLDLGSGCGSLGVLLCASDPNCREPEWITSTRSPFEELSTSIK